MSFAKLSKKLAEIGVRIDHLQLDYGAFGSWNLVATNGKEAMRFIFDGKESYLTAESSPVQHYNGLHKWKPIGTKIKIKNSSQAIEYTEKLLMEKY
jgi:hypothetical protein